MGHILFADTKLLDFLILMSKRGFMGEKVDNYRCYEFEKERYGRKGELSWIRRFGYFLH